MTLAERILKMRRYLGLSREELAKRLGVDESTLWDWELEKRRLSLRLKLYHGY